MESDRKERIQFLILEDNPLWRSLLSFVLEEFLGCQRIACASRRSDPGGLLRSYRPHIVIASVQQLASENDPGLRLVKQLQTDRLYDGGREKPEYNATYALCMIRQAHDIDYKQARTTLTEYGAWDFYIKDRFNVEGFLQAVGSIIQKQFQFNPSLDISYSKDLRPEDLVAKVTDAGVAELEELFQGLFSDAQRIDVISLGPSRGEAQAILIETYYPESPDHPRRCYVKIGHYDKIKSEFENYEGYTKVMKKVPSRLGFSRTFHLGGIVYEAIDEDSRPFSLFYQQEDASTIVSSIEEFFKKSCKYCYAARTGTEDISHFYRNQLALTFGDLERVLAVDLPSYYREEEVVFPEISSQEKFPNPVYYFDRATSGVEVGLCPTHGNFDTEHIFVDAYDDIQVVSFSRANGKGHILQDCTRLEASIKFELLANQQLEHWHEFENALLQYLGKSLMFDNSGNSQDLGKAFDVIRQLRWIAYDVLKLGENDFREYCLSLLYQTLDMLRWLPREKKPYVFLSAAMICQRLAEWDVGSQPQEITRGGMEMEYKELEKQLEQLNQLIRRKEFEEAYEGDYDQLKHDLGERLSSLIAIRKQQRELGRRPIKHAATDAEKLELEAALQDIANSVRFDLLPEIETTTGKLITQGDQENTPKEGLQKAKDAFEAAQKGVDLLAKAAQLAMALKTLFGM